MVDKGCVHAIASCLDCDWREEDYLKNVNILAHSHAKEYRHKVELELGFLFDGTKPSSQLKAFGITEEGYEDDVISEKQDE